MLMKTGKQVKETCKNCRTRLTDTCEEWRQKN